MKKMILAVAANYVILLLCLLFFGGGVWPLLLIPFVQLYLAIENYILSSNIKWFLFLQLHMLIATMAGNFANGQLFLKYVSNDAESVIILALIFRLGVYIVLTLSLLFGIAKAISAYKKRRSVKIENS